MNAKEARSRLRSSIGDDWPTNLPLGILNELTLTDLPKGASFQIGTMRDRCLHLDWSGRLYRDGKLVVGEADYTWMSAVRTYETGRGG